VRVFVCVCVCVRARVCVCVCVYIGRAQQGRASDGLALLGHMPAHETLMRLERRHAGAQAGGGGGGAAPRVSVCLLL
jgi:hypothetical protein